ncbi:hypothetical protein [uncultured Fibrobacter sp.]|uniref:hypothetical protein n=1 Tax=uncultured Fibrobacter sp. TaxID=261512 RepID=UPI0025F5E9B8|nr:hypothetical protein [uncultured Fibrobacter sp.]
MVLDFLNDSFLTITTKVAEPTEPSTNSNKKAQAKKRIQSLKTIDEARQMLDALCDLGYDTVLDIILK